MIASFIYSSPDSTELLNAIAKDILPMGVYIAPSPFMIIPGSGLQVSINYPWVVRNSDGMTIREDSIQQTITIPTQAPYYVGLSSQYVVSNTPSMALIAVLASDYDGLWTTAQKATFVIFAKVSVSAGTITQLMIDQSFMTLPRGVLALATDLVASTISTAVRVVNTVATLNALTPNGEEVVYCQDENSFYIYDNNTWKRVDNPLAGTANFSASVGTTITGFWPANLPNTRPYFVLITPTSSNLGHLGEFYVVKAAVVSGTPNSFTVYNTGSSTGSFDWLVIIPPA